MEIDSSASLNVAKSQYSPLESEPDVQIICDGIHTFNSSPNIRNVCTMGSFNSSVNSFKIFPELNDQSQLTTSKQIVHSESILKNMLYIPTSANLFADITSGLSPALCEQLKKALTGSNDFYGQDFSNCDTNLFLKDCEISNTDWDSSGTKPLERDVSTAFGKNIITNDNKLDITSESNKITGEFILTNFQDEDCDSLDSDEFLKKNKLSLETDSNTNMINSNHYTTNSPNPYSESANKFKKLIPTIDFNRNISSELNSRSDHSISGNSGFRLSDNAKFSSGMDTNRPNVESLNDPTIQYCAEKSVDSVPQSSCGEQNETNTQRKVLQKEAFITERGNVHINESPFTCIVCNEQFTNSQSLESHQHLHSNVQPVCNKEITVLEERFEAPSINLVETQIPPTQFPILHCETRLGETLSEKEFKYECDFCRVKFHTEQTLKYHKMFKHGHYFNKGFINSNVLASHTEEFHKSFTSDSISPLTLTPSRVHVQGVQNNEDISFSASTIAKSETNSNTDLSHAISCTYKCEECNKTFSVKEEFKHHLIEHFKQRVLKCDYCKECFASVVELKSHEQKHFRLISEKGLYPGDNFNISGFEPENRFGKEKLVANFCDKKRQKMDEGVNACPIPRYKCRLCGEKFSSSRKLRQHYKKHNWKRCYTCSICKELFSTPTEVYNHAKVHNDESMRHLTTGKKKTSDLEMETDAVKGKENSNIYKNKNSSLEDQNCDEHQEKNLSDKVTASPQLEIAPAPKISSYDCTKCGKRFQSEHGMKIHEAVHKRRTVPCTVCGISLMITRSTDQSNPAFSDDTFYKCFRCEKKSVEVKHQKSHYRKYSTECPSVTNSCDICHKTFQTRVALNVHRAVHINIKIRLCQICGETFRNLKYFKQHALTHLKEPQFKCNLCNKAFYCQKILDQHLKMHSQPLAPQFGNFYSYNSFYNASGYAQNFHHNHLQPVPNYANFI